MPLLRKRSPLLIPLLLLLHLILVSCSGGGGGSSSSSDRLDIVGTSSSSATLAVAKNVLQISEATTVSANFKNADGTPASGISVNFTTTLGTFTPADGVVVTDANGTATVQFTTGPVSGQGQILATATVSNKVINLSTLFSIVLPPLKLANIALTDNATGAIDFGSSQGISADVQDANGVLFTGHSVEVVFTSTQAALGKATINSPVSSVNGKVSTTYTALTATGPDVITASIAGSSQTINLIVNPLNAGSITYVSALPTTIGLKGMGGFGIQETSKVTFRVVDTSGAPKANVPVSFSLNTTVGGLTLSAETGSTASDGTVSTIVQAGVIATPVRVTATTNVGSLISPKILSTQSDQLIISTGIPAQDGVSMSVGTFNSESFNIDGVTVPMSIRLSDHFHNPVPDGTAAYFTTSGGAIEPSCTTVNGTCTVNWISQSPRPANGRPVILVYAVGEEAFLDLNGSGKADGSCLPDVITNGTGVLTSRQCGEFTDSSEAFRDDNLNRLRDASETFIDFNMDTIFNGPSGTFNGIFQPLGSSTTLFTQHVFQNTQIVMSSSEVKDSTFAISPTNIPVSPPSSIATLTVEDVNGNPMPAGTTIKFDSDHSLYVTQSFTVPNTPFSGLNSTIFNFALNNINGVGSIVLSVTVTTPSGVSTLKNFNINFTP